MQYVQLVNTDWGQRHYLLLMYVVYVVIVFDCMVNFNIQKIKRKSFYY